VPKLKPSPKSALPPRNPNAIWLPRLKAVNFASNAVIKRLKDAGLVLEEFDGIPDELALACIHNHIREIVSCYISDRAGALRNDVASAKIRKMVAKLERNVGDIIRQLPDESESALSADDRVIMEAIDRELDAIDCDEAPDLGIHPTSTPSGSGSTIAADQAATARRAACQFHGRRSAILFAG
jgi:hypothetical protein